MSYVLSRLVTPFAEGMQPKKVVPQSPSARRRSPQRSRPGRGPTRLGGTATQLADERKLRWYFRGVVGERPPTTAPPRSGRGALGVTWAAAHGSPTVELGGIKAFEQLLAVVQRRAAGAASKALRLAAFATVRA